MQCSVRSSSLATTVQYSMKYLITCFGKWELLRLLLQYSVTKTHFFAPLFFIIEFNVPRLTSAQNSYEKEKNAFLQNRTRSTLSYSVFRNRTGCVCLNHRQGVDRRENACPLVAYVSDLIRVPPHVFQLAEK